MKKSIKNHLGLLTIALCFNLIAVSQQDIYINSGDQIHFNIDTARGVLQWQTSTNSIDWDDIIDETENELTVTLNEFPAYFRLMINEDDCNTHYSETITVLELPVCGLTNTVTDVDGNTYDIIAIGNQCWTAQNLRTSHFDDGTLIENLTVNNEWANTTSPAWCHYNNNELTFEIPYGKLYNFYTVVDSRNVCPTGWHVPTIDEWIELRTFLGGGGVAGGKLKSTSLWQAPNTGATNEVDFTALPGGCRDNLGSFQFHTGLTQYGYWWSSSEHEMNDLQGKSITLNSESAAVTLMNDWKTWGSSVRCVKD
jgi:uncharacterized protein (TIGR02145 family)